MVAGPKKKLKEGDSRDKSIWYINNVVFDQDNKPHYKTAVRGHILAADSYHGLAAKAANLLFHKPLATEQGAYIRISWKGEK